MPKGIGLGPNVGHDYDPNLLTNTIAKSKSVKTSTANGSNEAFHNFSSNVPHLQNWIEQLVTLTISTDTNASKKSSSDGHVQYPTTETLVQALQRYNVVFQELFRQVGIFSDPLSKVSK
jgi:hypothetical protein